MTDPNWESLREVVVPAKPGHGFWTKVLDYVDASKRLQFVVEDERDAPPVPPGQQPPQPDRVPNKWSYAPEKLCTADGDPKAPINPANCLLVDAPPGALIAKIGGSTAGKNDGIKVFVVGSFCVVDLDEKTKGALYLTMNADPMSSLDKRGELSVKVYHSR